MAESNHKIVLGSTEAKAFYHGKKFSASVATTAIKFISPFSPTSHIFQNV